VNLDNLDISGPGWPWLDQICEVLNRELVKISLTQVKVAAIRWTAKGNLVITGAPPASPAMLQLSALHIGAILTKALHLPHNHQVKQPRANVKWSRITINSIPTGKSESQGPYTPEECHAALAELNPTYTTLAVTQWPSWVHPPTSYTSGTISSLSVAFEDHDRSKLRTLLVERYLYIYGNRASVKKWKQCPRNCKDTAETHTAQHSKSNEVQLDNNEEDVVLQLTQQPKPATPPPAPHKTRQADMQEPTFKYNPTWVLEPDSPFRLSDMQDLQTPPHHTRPTRTSKKGGH
jgi:hypothetical protein